jgi:transposase
LPADPCHTTVRTGPYTAVREVTPLLVDQRRKAERFEIGIGKPNRKGNGFSHCYKRHGTTTLFAALDVATGEVKTSDYSRRWRREFLDFMNEVVADNKGRKIHVILDNLNTHKPKRDRWLKRHPNVHLHFTPTYSSWLNQVECWFSILSRSALRSASFTSARQLRDAIDAFVSVYNENARPFEWTKAVVHPSAPKRLYSDLCK